MIKKLVLLAGIFLFACTGSSFGQMNIGYMNTQKVLNELPGRQKVQNEMNTFIKQKKKALTQKATKYQKAISEFQSNKATMSDDQVQTRKDELTALRNSLDQYNTTVRNQINQKRSQLLEPIFSRIDSTISAVAQSKNLDLVLNESTGAGEKLLFYEAKDQTDITPLVIKRLKSTSN